MHHIYKAKKLKILKLKSLNQMFLAVCHRPDDGKQLLISPFLKIIPAFWMLINKLLFRSAVVFYLLWRHLK